MKIHRTIILCALSMLMARQFYAQTPADQDHMLQFTPTQLAIVPVSTDSLNPGGEFTMSAWVYIYEPEPWAIFMGKSFESRHIDPWYHFALSLNDLGDKITFSQSTGVAGSLREITSTSTVQPYHWVHVAASLKNDTMRLFVNGSEEAWCISAGVPARSAVPFSLGAVAPLVENYCCGFSGVLAQAGIWYTALNAADISMYADSVLTGNEPGLRAYWPLNEGSGQIAHDLSPNHLDLRLGLQPSDELQDPAWIMEYIVTNGPFFKRHFRNMPDTASNYGDFYVFDYNSDGTDDFITTTVHIPPTVPATYQALKSFGCTNGILTNSTDSVLGWIEMVQPRHTTINDFNNDGLNDIFIVGHGTDTPPYGGEQSKLLVQTPSGTLNDETNTRIPAASDFTHHVSSGDVNGDGFPDIFMDNVFGGTNGPRLYYNNASGILSVAPGTLDPVVSNMVKKYTGCCFFDADNDGDDDLYLGGHGGLLSGENFPMDIIYLNDGSGHFTGDTALLPPRHGGPQWGSLAVACADFDQNGYQDLLLSVHNLYSDPTVQLLLNNGNLTFTDATNRIPVTWGSGTGHLCWIDTADFNNDGWMDFLLSKGGDIFTHRLFLNSGQAKFVDATYLIPFTLPDIPAARPGKFDSDNDADIIIIWQNIYCFFENFKDFKNSIATINPSGVVLVPDTSSFALQLNANTGTNLTYRWLHNGQEINGATGTSYTASLAGEYRVIVKHDFYPADTSIACIIGQQEPSGISSCVIEKISVIPNPSTGIFKLTGLPAGTEKFSIAVTNITGNTLLSKEVSTPEPFIDITVLPQGIYFIAIRSHNLAKTLRIIKL